MDELENANYHLTAQLQILREKLKEKDFEVLLMTDPVDEWVVQSLTEYEEKPLKSAEKGDLDLDAVDDSKKEDFKTEKGIERMRTKDQRSIDS